MLKSQKVVIFISRKISNKQKFNKCSTYKADSFNLSRASPLLCQAFDSIPFLLAQHFCASVDLPNFLGTTPL